MSTLADKQPAAPAPTPHRPPRARRRARPPRGGTRTMSQGPPARTATPTPPAGRFPVAFSPLALLGRHRAIAAVLALYALVAAFVVPTFTPAPVGDDWVYARSVEILLANGELRVLDLSVVTLVVQVAWGALFAALFGPGFGVLRLSTVALTLLGGWACYGLCRELGVDRGRSALGAAAYLFNPLAFVLAFTFMTDPHFTALLVIATLGYARGLRVGATDRAGRLALLGGSVAAALAFGVRQQGVLIPLAVVVALALGRRLRPDRAGAALLGRVVAAPALAVAGYYLWLVAVHGVPEQQGSFARTIREAGWDDSVLLVERMGFVGAMYLGFFALPVVVAALAAGGRLVRFDSAAGWMLVAAWAGALAVGLLAFDALGRDIPPMPRMPYVPQYLGPHGLGPHDLHGARAWLVGWGALDWATAACAVASLLFALLLCRRLDPPAESDPTRATAGVVLSIALWQAVGALPPSFHFRDWIVSVDRYLLPLLPLALALGLWALRGLPAATPLAWWCVTAFACFAVAGTRDFLVLQDESWKLARAATRLGVPLTRLDAGAAWDGYHLWEYSQRSGLPNQTPNSPWWVDLFAPATNSDYVVSTSPLAGYDPVGRLPYSSWLEDDTTELFLLRRSGLTGVP